MFIKIMQTISLYAVPCIILIIPAYAFFIKKVKVYEVFCEGAKEGIDVVVRILPFLLGMLITVGVLRASGAIDLFVSAVNPIVSKIGIPGELLPILIFNPISGGAARASLLDIFNTYGPDSFLGKAGSMMFGSTETTLYVLSVYFGSVGIIKSRHAVPAGLCADMAGMISAIFIAKIVFGG
ncbi:MAG: spore maturation protein [Brevinemataceae bacterium]